MTTKDIWRSLSEQDKLKQVTDTLDQLVSIDEGTHHLSDKPEQGILSNIRRDLEQFLINVAEWENNPASVKPKH